MTNMAKQGETGSNVKRRRRRRVAKRGSVERLGDVLADLLASRGYAQIQTTSACVEAWRQAAGEQMAKHSRPGNIKRGVLEVTVRNSAAVQELTFQKTRLVSDLARLIPEQEIRDVRFRVGQID